MFVKSSTGESNWGTLSRAYWNTITGAIQSTLYDNTIAPKLFGPDWTHCQGRQCRQERHGNPIGARLRALGTRSPGLLRAFILQSGGGYSAAMVLLVKAILDAIIGSMKLAVNAILGDDRIRLFGARLPNAIRTHL